VAQFSLLLSSAESCPRELTLVDGGSPALNADTLCIILHYGEPDVTDDCVRSARSNPAVDIVVADNSEDQDYLLPLDLQKLVKVFKTGGNLGFAVGYNVTAERFLTARHRYLFLLNNDTVMAPSTLSKLKVTLSEWGAGAIGPAIFYQDQPKELWAAGGYIDRFKLRIGALKNIHSGPHSVDYLPGAAILVRADVWKRIGGFDKSYFLAFEEAVFACEIKRLGFDLIVDPHTRLFHRVGMSRTTAPKYVYNSARNMLQFGRYLHGAFLGSLLSLLPLVLLARSRKPTQVVMRLALVGWAVWDHWLGQDIDAAKLRAVDKSWLNWLRMNQ
jgi:GT2 family glycosyltransferase